MSDIHGSEIALSLRPSLKIKGAPPQLRISTPYAKRGALWIVFKEKYGVKKAEG